MILNLFEFLEIDLVQHDCLCPEELPFSSSRDLISEAFKTYYAIATSIRPFDIPVTREKA